MDPFIRHRGVAAPMLRPNIDTDAIIPSREMKRVSKLGLGQGLFADERYVGGSGREPNPDFVLNRPQYAGASILIAGANFGCGSSREHAVWALKEYGVRAIIAPGFGAIFANNCVRNGLLPVVLDEAEVRSLADWVAADPQAHQPLIDLEAQRVEGGPVACAFALDEGARRMLLEGLDAIALTLTRGDAIRAFHERRREQRPWLYPAGD
jgi:3-isopropylmalate/(R)-2-methylmalate dehydratase small subunit